MDLPSHELQAFRMVSQTLSFSQAAERIHITQPALSQRIQSLEKTLGLTLFIRDPRGIKLTEAGLRLLRYCQIKDHLESELLSDLVKTPDGRLGGRLTIAAYSTVLHSVIMPALAPLLRDNPGIQFEFKICQTDALIGLLERAEADFIVLDRVVEKNTIRNLLLGEEKYVLIQGVNHPVRERYLDHDPTDRITELFFKAQGGEKRPALVRSYVEDVEGILRGVELGLGQGVVPRHLLKDEHSLRVAKGLKSLKVPVVLHYFRQSYYSNLQKAAIETLKLNCKEHLR
jgi:DNA-binding transcriptional LysR family regulator